MKLPRRVDVELERLTHFARDVSVLRPVSLEMQEPPPTGLAYASAALDFRPERHPTPGPVLKPPNECHDASLLNELSAGGGSMAPAYALESVGVGCLESGRHVSTWRRRRRGECGTGDATDRAAPPAMTDILTGSVFATIDDLGCPAGRSPSV